MSRFLFPFFVARRLSGSKAESFSTTDKMVRFAVVGIALCVAVMLLTIFIGSGFNHEVKKRLSFLTGDIKLSTFSSSTEEQPTFFHLTAEMEKSLLRIPSVEKVRRVVQLAGLIKTDSAFRGVVALGFDSITIAALERTLLHTSPAPETRSFSAPQAILSSPVAEELQLEVKDRFPFYSLGERPSLRVLTLKGKSDIPEVNGGILILPINYLQKQARLAEDEVSYVEIFLKSGLNPEEEADKLARILSETSFSEGQHLALNTARELMPALFDWVDMLDANTFLLLSIMAIVAGFTAITGILVLMLGRTRMIGVLKALGTSGALLHQLFLLLGGNIALRGLFWGNLIAFVVAMLQKGFKILTLDPSIYYISYVPIDFTWKGWILVNLVALAVILIMLILPTRIVSRIKVADTLRFS